jgi:two-component system chemotaxis sensor kinase CheA
MSAERPESNTATPDPPNSLAADPELLGEFIVEAREHLAGIEIQALALEQNPGDTDAIHTMFRAFHTIKGLAGFLDLGAMQAVSHEVETILDMARNAQMQITHTVIDGILESKDFLNAWIASLDDASAGGDREPGPDPQVLLGRIASLSGAGLPVCDQPENDSLQQLTLAVAADPVAELEPAATPPKGSEGTQSGVRRKDIALVKVQTTKLDYLVDMMGEMVITQSLIRHDPDLGAEGKPRLARNLSQLARITDEVQRTAMSMRMVPIGQLFHKMSRLVRDLSQKNGKAVELLLEGENTELDRNIVEQLADPLMHMVRNALDHGIEPREARLKSGKSATAHVTLKAGHQSGHIVIHVADDGRGLDREKILRKAIDRGLTTTGAALTEAEVYNFIFHPGFSTADQVTDVSGRGVGMDVVRKQIQKLRGRVEIQSVRGQGTTFQLKLPLTLAIIDGLVAGVGRERYIIPIYTVREMLRPGPEMVSTVQGRVEMALVRGALLPIVRLHQSFDVEPRSTDPCDCLLIVAENGDKRFCLMVDELIGKQEVVIKSLGEKFQHVQGVAGGAILGDGRVGLILDLERLVGGDSRGGNGE